MRNFWTVFIGSCKHIWSDPTNAFLLIVFPILLIVILGSALSSVINDDGNVKIITIGYYSNDTNDKLKNFLTDEDFPKIFSLSEMTADQIESSVLNENSKIDIGLIELDGEIQLIKGTNKNAHTILNGVLSSREMISNSIELSFQNGGNPTDIIDTPVKINHSYLGGKTRSATDYYAITMSIMFLLFSGIYCCSVFQKNIQTAFGERLNAAPISRTTVILGTLAAPTFASFLNGVFVMLFTKYILGVNWGENLFFIIFTIFIITLFSQTLFFFVYSLCNNPDAANGIMQGLIWTMTFSSSGMAKIDWGELQPILNFTPNKMAQDIFFTEIYGGDNSVISRNFVILLALTVVFAALSIILARRRLKK